MSNGSSINFEDDLRKEILSHLQYNKYDQIVLSILSQKKTSDLLIIFKNWIDRHIHPHPRKVFLSKEFIQNPLRNRYLEKIEFLLQKIKKGDNITEHLSRRVNSGYVNYDPAVKISRRKDRDLLLNDWGIHHVHFFPRGGDAMYIIFDSERAFILDVGPHDFFNPTLVEIAVRNWPEAQLFYGFNGISPDGLTDEQRKKARNSGLNTVINIDGKCYMSRRAGISLAGTSNIHTMQTIQFLRDLSEITELYIKDPDCFRGCVELTGRQYPKNPEFKLILIAHQTSYDFAIQELKTGAIFWPGNNPFHARGKYRYPKDNVYSRPKRWSKILRN